MRYVSAFVCGTVFAIGLGISGMTQPTKVIGFLDVAGAWDPTLAFVMGGAVLVSATLFPRILRRRTAVLDDHFALPEKKTIDGRLLIGAAVFGVGWGLSGYCPGPAIVSLVTGARPVVVFVAFMLAGLYLGGRVHPNRGPRDA
ncbi:MAG TPA: YeeE/YedE family protein [Candidatus Binatia bacterium]|nr:YeeE/YedE family protein [Candidatus Binatia bacterium]